MESHSLLQGIFPTQGSNPNLLHFRKILYHLSHLGQEVPLEKETATHSSILAWKFPWMEGFLRQVTEDKYNPAFTSRTVANVISICREPETTVVLSAHGNFQCDGWSMKCMITSGEMFDPFQGLLQRRQWHPTPVILPGKSH